MLPVERSRAIRLPEVCHLLGISRATVWRKAKTDPGFPKPFHLSPAIAVWDEGQVLTWLDSKKAARVSVAA
jgi:predicted DNA-binding transcriptional regulator AlpA